MSPELKFEGACTSSSIDKVVLNYTLGAWNVQHVAGSKGFVVSKDNPFYQRGDVVDSDTVQMGDAMRMAGDVITTFFKEQGVAITIKQDDIASETEVEDGVTE